MCVHIPFNYSATNKSLIDSYIDQDKGSFQKINLFHVHTFLHKKYRQGSIICVTLCVNKHYNMTACSFNHSEPQTGPEPLLAMQHTTTPGCELSCVVVHCNTGTLL